MARKAIDKARVRSALEPRREPYWGSPIGRGLFLGFRKLDVGGTWVARWHDDGAHRYHALGHVDDVAYDDAVKAAQTWAKAARHGVVKCEVVTVADACTKYVQRLRNKRRDATADDAQGRFERTLGDLGKIKLERLTSAKLADWREGLGLSPAAANRTLTALKAALNNAVKVEGVNADCAKAWRGMAPDDVVEAERPYLTMEQRNELIAALPDYARPFVQVLALTPLRPGALASCLVKDLKKDTLVIRHDKTKRATGRTVQLSDRAAAILRAQAKDKLPNAPLVSVDGGPWTKDRWSQLVRRTVKRLGDLPEGTCLYALRHSAISDLVSVGLDLSTIAKEAGTSLLMINRRYHHPDVKLTRAALNNVA